MKTYAHLTKGHLEKARGVVNFGAAKKDEEK